MKRILFLTTLISLCTVLISCASIIPITIYPSTDVNAVGSYIYGSTNNNFTSSLATYQIKQDIGTNSNFILTNIPAGSWYFTGTAYSTNKIESVNCNVINVAVPSAPTSIAVTVTH